MNVEPDSSAVRVALWRALHLRLDTPPHLIEDDIGLRLVAPPPDWMQRGDMHPLGTRGYRASILNRARFIEDLVLEEAQRGITQYVILGAGLDSFAQRRPALAGNLQVFEIDQPGPQAWKRRRLMELGFGIPSHLKLVPVDFEAGQDWYAELVAAGFDPHRPAVIASTGVSMYLSREANLATLRQIAAFAPGSTLAMTFVLPPGMLPEAERAAMERVMAGARAAGTPFLSLFTPGQMLDLVREAGFTRARHLSTADLNARYLAGRSDGLLSATGEDFIVART